jgi:hypothetical protein
MNRVDGSDKYSELILEPEPVLADELVGSPFAAPPLRLHGYTFLPPAASSPW